MAHLPNDKEETRAALIFEYASAKHSEKDYRSRGLDEYADTYRVRANVIRVKLKTYEQNENAFVGRIADRQSGGASCLL
jgi:hypothetical protein